MARYTGTIETDHGVDTVWSYLADLRSLREWDPSVEHVELTGGEPRTESARYRLEVRFRGKTVSLPYRVIEVERPHRVVFAAETDSVTVRDEARIEPLGDRRSRVTWDAELRLNGIRRLFELPLRAAFARIGQRAERGLAERLRRPDLEADVDRLAA